MSDEVRAQVAALLRQALALLDREGERRAAPHLQLALDLLDEPAPVLAPDWRLPTCH